MYTPVHLRDKQIDSSFAPPVCMRSADHWNGTPSLAGKPHSGPSSRWQLWEPWTGVQQWGWEGHFSTMQCTLETIQRAKAQLTSSLTKYLRVKSLRESRNVLLRKFLFSLPFFQSVNSKWSIVRDTQSMTMHAQKYIENSAAWTSTILSTTWGVCLW